MDEYAFPPDDLIRIMCNYYLNEVIHLFVDYNSDKHWKIDVLDIFL